MLDFSFPELLLIVALAVLVIGPQEIPAVMRGLGRIVRRLQYVRFAMSRRFDEFMQENDLDELRRSVNFEEKDFNEARADDPAINPAVEPAFEREDEEHFAEDSNTADERG